MDDSKLRDLVNSSGFPLQIGIENYVNKTHLDHNWKVLLKEHAWKNETSGSNGFIDLILQHKEEIMVMIVECKRVKDSSWVFLVPDNITPKSHKTKVWFTEIEGNKITRSDWEVARVSPESFESEFCVVMGQNKEKPLLERLAGDLIESTEGFAIQDIEVLNKNQYIGCYYLSVLVTTADLKICCFNPDKISLGEGKIENMAFETVPYIRFRKQLSADRGIEKQIKTPGRFRRYQEIAKANENTVFVVNSSYFPQFLKVINVDEYPS